MDRIQMSFAPAIFAVTLSVAAFAAEPPVMVNVSHLPPNVAAEVERAAAQGMTSLKRYLEATRKQHGLALEDVTRPMDARAPDDITPPRKDYKQHAVDWKPAK
jgi:hypothetical protein